MEEEGPARPPARAPRAPGAHSTTPRDADARRGADSGDRRGRRPRSRACPRPRARRSSTTSTRRSPGTSRSRSASSRTSPKRRSTATSSSCNRRLTRAVTEATTERPLMATRTFDAIVIGGGPGGYVCAIRLGQLKQKVALHREGRGRRRLPQLGLRPVQGAHLARATPTRRRRTAPSMGIIADGIRVDANKMQDWKEGIVKKLTGGVRGLLKGNGAELLMGDARVTGPHTVEVKTREGRPRRSRPRRPSSSPPARPRSSFPPSSSTASRSSAPRRP